MNYPNKLLRPGNQSTTGPPGGDGLWPNDKSGDMADFLVQSPKILAALNALLMEVNSDLKVERIFPSAYKFTLFIPEQLPGSHVSQFLNVPQFRLLQKKIQDCIQSGKDQKVDLWLKNEKETKCLESTLYPFTRSSVLFIGNDISSVRHARQELDSRVRFYTSLINHSSDMMTVLSEDGSIVFESPALRSVLGFQEHQVMGAEFPSLLHPEDLPAVRRAICQTPFNQTSNYFEFRRKDCAGEWVFLEGLATNLLQDDAIQGTIINARNITERKTFEQERERHLFQDPLTQLPNRTRLLDRLSQSIHQRRRESNYQFAFILINLDRFKAVNNNLGWDQGDQFLNRVAAMLREDFREVDTIARIGSDEFGLLINGFSDARAPVRVVERLKDKIGHTFVVKGQEISFSASMGIAYGTADIASPEQILRHAETAMYKAKTDHASTYRIFHSKMHIQTLNLLQLENELRKAVEKEEFELHYQPILDLVSGEIVSFEALLRWRHPEKGLVPPDRFIPLAEETGLILPIGLWVVEHACREIMALNALRTAPCMLNVNLSARQLSDPNLLMHIVGILNNLGFPPQLLHLEMTESALIQHEPRTARLFDKFKKKGLNFVVDDFGTGYSSLKYLHDYPFETLKIDRSFTQSLNGKINKNERIIQSIITLAGNLNMEVVAEGIEKKHQLEKLKELNCRYGQGFYFSRPIPINEIIRRYGRDIRKFNASESSAAR